MGNSYDFSSGLDINPLIGMLLIFGAYKALVGFATWAARVISGFFGGSSAERVGRAADRAAAARQRGDTRAAERHERQFQRELVRSRRS